MRVLAFGWKKKKTLLYFHPSLLKNKSNKYFTGPLRKEVCEEELKKAMFHAIVNSVTCIEGITSPSVMP